MYHRGLGGPGLNLGVRSGQLELFVDIAFQSCCVYLHLDLGERSRRCPLPWDLVE
jgi:hypothetical protein